mmetsp:Transcript_24237/g.43107  ORF Transcript_24237/g.43107 Transcript_24237/m.43107 type:complete len:407 (-) Transcript_24237:19-1239(-)
METSWDIKASEASMNTDSMIRTFASLLRVPEDHPLKTLNLTYGDPSVYTEFPPAPQAVQILQETLASERGNGYMPTLGTVEVRQALADAYSNEIVRLTYEDVAIDFGGIGAIYHTIRTLCNEGDNFLFPSPGYTFYHALSNITYQAKTYRLLPDQNWEADLEHLESQIDEKTRLIVIINPSNPCGSVYTREHLTQIIAIAQRHRLPVLADEVYEKMVFSKPFVSCAELCEEVPVIVVGSLSKRWLVPGWRLGWSIVFDKLGVMGEFKTGLMRLKNGLIHPTTFVAKALPRILTEVPESFFQETNEKLKRNAELIYRLMNSIPGLRSAMPEGAIYASVTIDFSTLDDIKNSVDFVTLLAKEKAVAVLPLEAFLGTCGFRLVLCNPISILDELASRLREFMENHKTRV